MLFQNSQRIQFQSFQHQLLRQRFLIQHYTRLAQNRFPEQKMLENDRMETKSTAVNFVNLESRIHVEVSTSNQCHISNVDFPFKIDKISTNFLRGISTSNRWRIDEDMSIGYLLLEPTYHTVKFDILHQNRRHLLIHYKRR